MMLPRTVFTRFGGALVLPPGALRLLLAMAVVISHISRLNIGVVAVFVFFYLSGYWVALIWRTKFGPGSTQRFYAARYLRVAPLYLIVVCAAAGLRHEALQPANLSLLGVASSSNDPIEVAWSLDIELQFYLLAPLLVAWLSTASLANSAVVLTGIAVAGYALGALAGVITVAKYLPLFALGVLTDLRAWRPRLKTANISLVAFVALTVLTIFTTFFSKAAPDPFDEDLWSFLWTLPLLPYVARSLTLRSSPLDRAAGNVSYPLYLVHFPVISVMVGRLGEAGWVKAAAIGVCLATAVCLYRLVDRPIDALRLRLTEPAKGLGA